MTRKLHWTLILFAIAAILGVGLNMLTFLFLSTFVFLYWLLRGLYKRQWYFALKVLLTPFTILIIHCLLNYDRIQTDGKKAELYSLFDDDSNYSPDFSQHAFNKIKIGMTKMQVIELVGEPLQIFPYEGSTIHTDKLGFQYCRSIHDASYRVRVVHFNGDTVIRIIKEFYYD